MLKSDIITVYVRMSRIFCMDVKFTLEPAVHSNTLILTYWFSFLTAYLQCNNLSHCYHVSLSVYCKMKTLILDICFARPSFATLFNKKHHFLLIKMIPSVSFAAAKSVFFACFCCNSYSTFIENAASESGAINCYYFTLEILVWKMKVALKIRKYLYSRCLAKSTWPWGVCEIFLEGKTSAIKQTCLPQQIPLQYTMYTTAPL